MVIGSAHFASGLSYILRNHNARTQEFTSPVLEMGSKSLSLKFEGTSIL